MTCELHLLHTYIFPSWFAMTSSLPFRLSERRRAAPPMPLTDVKHRAPPCEKRLDTLLPIGGCL